MPTLLQEILFYNIQLALEVLHFLLAFFGLA